MNHWTPKRINALFQLSTQMGINPKSDYAKDKILCEAFFEPSTRTALSFECAMKKMGGEVIHFNYSTSSKQKGESDLDSILTLANYCDGIVLRHPDPDFFSEAQRVIASTINTNIPLINAGSGSGTHPTQALLDLYTIYKKYGRDFQHKRILFVGDIRYSRAIHSFIDLLKNYPNIQVYLHPYENCEPLEHYVTEIARDHYMDIDEVVIDKEFLFYQDYDVIYLSRLQIERHEERQDQEQEQSLNESDSECEKTETGDKSACDSSSDDNDEEDDETNTELFYFTTKDAACLNSDAIIMHPFPRNDELHPDVDAFPQAYYFQQMKYGVELRMGLLELIFHEEQKKNNKNRDTKKDKYISCIFPKPKPTAVENSVIIFFLLTILGGHIAFLYYK